jgi:hypothetical protein
MAVVFAADRSRAAAASTHTDDSDWATVQTNKGIDVADNNAESSKKG